MIDFHYWPTPNGWKVAIMLEECGLALQGRWSPAEVRRVARRWPVLVATDLRTDPARVFRRPIDDRVHDDAHKLNGVPRMHPIVFTCRGA